MGVSGAQAQSIHNTAAAQWVEQGRTLSINSNTVTITVQQAAGTVEVLKPSTGGGGAAQSINYLPSTCGGQKIAISSTHVGEAEINALESANKLYLGEVMYVSLKSTSVNNDPSQIDSVIANLTTDGGERESITVFETSANSGEFIGAIQTVANPPAAVQGDCRLSVAPGDQVQIEFGVAAVQEVIASTKVEILADPFGLVFDSEDGSPVDGVRMTLVDALTGAPARVFAPDGTTPWPSTMMTGEVVTDGAGNRHPMSPGEYQFPLTAFGNYRLLAEPPAPYSAPSKASVTQLSVLHRPDGQPLALGDGSFGGTFAVAGPEPVRVDIPLDRPSAAVGVTKTASRANALPGDMLVYTIIVQNADKRRVNRAVQLVDIPAPALRFRRDSLRIDGAPVAANIADFASDGRRLTISLGDIAPGKSRTITYAMTVRPDANAGQAINRVTVTDRQGVSATAGAIVQIEREDLASRNNMLGRIVGGGCDIGTPHIGIAGVRVTLEDGSFAVTDAEGRYHFSGLLPGSHVVQAQTNTLPKGGKFVDCAHSTRSAGRANSRFVIGQGGSLMTADFFAVIPENKAPVAAPPASDEMTTRTAAGAEINWLQQGNGPTAFLFPAPDHNPRAPAVRVAIRHKVTEKIELLVNGKPVDPVAFDNMATAPGGTFAVSLWRGIPLDGEVTHLSAVVRSEKGAILSTLTRDVHFVGTPAQVELLPDHSRLIADGATRPVLALRMTDRAGRPVHAGLTGEFMLSSPYESAEAIDARQSQALSGTGNTAPRWLVKGDDGIAYVELAPTMTSGKLHMEFAFQDGQQRRRQALDSWIMPGKQAWTVTGLVEAGIGAVDVADQMQRTTDFDSDLGRNARVAVYAKGPVTDDILVTAAYDSAKPRQEQNVQGAIDPRAYYSVFADGSERLFDAASRDKFYVRVEGRGLTALYGDFDAGFDQTQLGRYLRTATGVRGEIVRGGVHMAGFAAQISFTHRRDEFQGGGISGPYRLSSRGIIIGSEVVTLEVRDRFRSEVIISHRTLARFIDYDIDVLSGTISFKEPVLSRDQDLNPQFVVIDFELDHLAGGGPFNAGLRTDWTTKNGKLRVGSTIVTDTGSAANGNNSADARTELAAVDVRVRLGHATELRAEAGRSFHAGTQADAWLIEVEHHAGRLDLLAYARSASQDFGLGQMSGAERGRRKFGLDARYEMSESISLTASTWNNDSLRDASHRTAVQIGAVHRTRRTDARIGLATMHDTRFDGREVSSNVLEGGATQRLFDNRLEIAAATSLALGKSAAQDLPARHRLTSRYSLSKAVRLIGSYEIANGTGGDSRTARAGLEVSPWQGARVVTGLGQQTLAEAGKRSFASFGLAQSFEVNRHLSISATLDAARNLGQSAANHLNTPPQPPVSGGRLAEGGRLEEDYTALTTGATWRNGAWSISGRGEYRDGQTDDRKGLNLGAVRQLGEGSMVGGSFGWTRATAAGGASSAIFNSTLAVAHRPANAPYALLGKLELRADKVVNAVAGQAGLAGSAFTVSGNARSTRMIGSVALNWSPKDRDGNQFVQRREASLFAAVRYNLDKVADLDFVGTTLIAGLDARWGLNEYIDLGGRTSVRANLADHSVSFSYGPEIGITPETNVLLSIGYNVKGYRDRDFSAARNTNKGIYVTARLKLDNDSFSFLGMGR